MSRWITPTVLAGAVMAACVMPSASRQTDAAITACDVELIVLGAGQDAGAPQIGNRNDPAWVDPRLQLTATSLGLVDNINGQRFLFEATPHITRQLQQLDELAPAEGAGLGLAGVFLTHAHIGHYVGLMMLGREAAGATGVPVYAMPRMAEYLSTNGPWSQLVALGNIAISPMTTDLPVALPGKLSVTPLRVPHRDEYSETVAFLIEGPDASALFVPDIDSWKEWETDFGVHIDDLVQKVDYAFLDATFFDDNELPGRDMSEIPHPRVAETMDLFDPYPADIRSRVRFIHYNHTNPIRFPASEESREVERRGYGIARAGDRVCLGAG